MALGGIQMSLPHSLIWIMLTVVPIAFWSLQYKTIFYTVNNKAVLNWFIEQQQFMKFLYYLTIQSTTQWTGLFPTTPQRRNCPLFDVTWESNLTFKVTEFKFTQFYELKWHHSEFVLWVAELKYIKILKWMRLIFSCLLSLHWEPLSPFLVAV